MRRRRAIRLGAVAVLIALTIGLANCEVTTKQGVNFAVSTHRLPLYAKAIGFVDRAAQYRQIASEITQGAASDRERAVRVFDWTIKNIRPTPAGWPVVDDHILHIIIRGHGLDDQRADVFAMLATSAGLPAFWRKVRAPGTDDGVILTFLRVDRRWVVADVANRFLFKNRSGDLATAEELGADPGLLPEAARSMTVGSTPYSHIFTGSPTPPIPRTLRAEQQMPWPRLRYELRRAVGLEKNDESQR